MMNERFLKRKGDRADLYLDSDGICVECGKKLEPGWHVDHIIPWSKGGKTVLKNLRALCPECNLKKGNKIMSLTSFQAEELNHFSNDFPNADFSKVRTCQKGAYNIIIEKLVYQKSKACSVFLPTGTGKSWVVLEMAIGLMNRGFCSGVWAFSPSTYLRDQLVTNNIDIFFDHIGMLSKYHYSPFIKCDSLDTERFREKSILESWTVQFLINGKSDMTWEGEKNNVHRFVKAARNLYNRTGKMPVAVFDESHLYSTDNKWGKAAKIMQEAGIPIVLITGTPYRSDNIEIPGFNTTLISEGERRFTKTHKHDDPLMISVEKGIRKYERYKLTADYEYSYSRAWEEGIILKPKPDFVDATETTYSNILSEMSKSNSSRLLRAFLMDKNTIESCVARCIESLQRRKANNDECAAIVATLADNEDDNSDDHLADIHANKIALEFARQATFLRVLIVTANNNSDGLSIFKKHTDYDVLIVKTMGTIGFDCSRIKTVLNLSNYRTLPATIQLANRAGRLFGDHEHYDLIMPKDKAMLEIWKQFQDETGLEIEIETSRDSEIYDKVLEENECEPKNPSEFIDHTWNCDPDVHRNDNDDIIELFSRKFPEMVNKFNTEQLLSHYSTMAAVHGDNWLINIPDYKHQRRSSSPIDMNEEESRLRKEANHQVREITNELLSTCGVEYSRKTYGECIKDVWTCVKRCCGFSPNQSLTNITGITNYNKVISACELLTKEIRRRPEGFNYKVFLRNYRKY